MGPNRALDAAMRSRNLGQAELAELLNEELQRICGRRGTLTDRHVRRWLTGECRWPHPPTRAALAAVFGCTAQALGFVPRGTVPEEAPVRRRTFLVTSGAAVAGPAAFHRVGSADVDRLAGTLAALVAADDQGGGTAALEQAAVRHADDALELQRRGGASARVRAQLYGLAAAFTSSAMWAAGDAGRFGDAQGYLHRAVALAELSSDPGVKYRVWGHAGALYRQAGRPADALAAQDVARSTAVARRDPLFVSLALARAAVAHGARHDARAVRRSLGAAGDALARADTGTPRPPWMRFYDQAEYEGLSMLGYMRLGWWGQAEAHAHRSLAMRGPGVDRNRALTLADLARAQLEQGEAASAVATAITVDPGLWHGRVRVLVGRFGDRLNALAPGTAEARAWNDHVEAVRATDGRAGGPGGRHGREQ